MKIEYECIMEMNGGKERNMLAEDLNPHAYVFSPCNEKIRAFVAQPTKANNKMIDAKEMIYCQGAQPFQVEKRRVMVHNLLGKVSLPEFITLMAKN